MYICTYCYILICIYIYIYMFMYICIYIYLNMYIFLYELFAHCYIFTQIICGQLYGFK